VEVYVGRVSSIFSFSWARSFSLKVALSLAHFTVVSMRMLAFTPVDPRFNAELEPSPTLFVQLLPPSTFIKK
jgi:hypothetical protein